MRAVNTLISSAWISPLLALASFALVGAITPGPVNVLAFRHGAQGMHRQALLYVLGASVSYMGVVACMALGSAQLQHRHPGLLHPAQGQSLAQAAHAMGFADQAHLQRAFKAHHAATPGCYAQALVTPAPTAL